MADANHNEEALRNAAEQFLAACKDGNVTELLDYFKDIFREALGEDVANGDAL